MLATVNKECKNVLTQSLFLSFSQYALCIHDLSFFTVYMFISSIFNFVWIILAIIYVVVVSL